MKRLWIELQRWNNSRRVRCTCGMDRRVRADLAHWIAARHAEEHSIANLVTVRRG